MKFKILAMAAAFALAASGANAGTFQAAPHGSYLLDMDTGDGNFSLWETKDVADINAVQAHITFARKGKSKDYAPSFRITLETAGDVSARVDFSALPKSGPLIGFVTTFKGRDETGRELIIMGPEFAEPFDLKIAWTADGKISVDTYDKAVATIGQGFEHHQADVGQAITAVSVSVSTGEVEFNKLELGTVTP